MKILNNIDITKNEIQQVKRVQFDTTAPEQSAAPGALYWSPEDLTLSLGSLNGSSLEIGQEIVYPATNQSGATITNGTVVMSAGALGTSGKVKIAPADFSGATPNIKILGVVTHDILNGAVGHVTWFGKVRGLNTTGSTVGETWAEGDQLWGHPSQPGKLTKVQPTAPALKVAVAIVISVHATQGVLLVRMDLGSKLGESDSNVKISSLTNKDVLQYNSTTGVWENAQLPLATTSADGLMSAADKTKLNGIATGAEVNQNAFTTIAVSGQPNVVADSKTDTLTLVAGEGISLTTNATTDSITIAANSSNNSMIVQEVKSSYTLSSAGNTVPIGITGFDSSKDFLFVYINSVYSADYTISGTSIVKNSGTWDAGTVFNFVALVAAPYSPGTTSTTVKREIFTATAGQTIFNLTTGSYQPGTSTLDVFVNGIKRSPTTYTETNSTRVTFNSGLNAGDSVLFQWFETLVFPVAVTNHAGTHKSGGNDPITPSDIGAASASHTHTLVELGAASANHTHTVANITNFPSSMPANGGHSTSTNYLKGSDTRNVNSPPSAYMSGGALYNDKTSIMTEFKYCSAIEVDHIIPGMYCQLVTFTPWSDSSGGYPIQLALGSNGKIATRTGVNPSTWSQWIRYIDESGGTFYGDVTMFGQLVMPSINISQTGTVVLDFSGPSFRNQGPLTGNIIYTGSNYASGRSVTVRVINGATQRDLAFPSGWRFVGSKPTNIAANKVGILTITCFGNTESDCVAAWAVEE